MSLHCRRADMLISTCYHSRAATPLQRGALARGICPGKIAESFAYRHTEGLLFLQGQSEKILRDDQ